MKQGEDTELKVVNGVPQYRRMTAEFFDHLAATRTGLGRVVNVNIPNKELENGRQREAVLGMIGDWEGLSVLDVGCGIGRWTSWFAEMGCDVVGVDWSENMLSACREEHPGVSFKRADITSPGFTRGRRKKYDVAFVWGVFYHITDEVDWRQAVRNLCDASKGRVLYCNKVNDNATRDYVRIWSPEEIVAEVESTGEFKLVQRDEYLTHNEEDVFNLFLFERVV